MAATALAATGTLAQLITTSAAQDSKGAQSQGNPSNFDTGAPELILFNGQISTLDNNNSTVSALAVRGNVIIATGADSQVLALSGPKTRKVNLKDRRVLPGLIDGHLHGMRTGVHCWSQGVRIDQVTERTVALDTFRQRAEQNVPGTWIWMAFGGWNVQQLDDPRPLTFEELTAAAPNNPLWITGYGMREPRVNQAALNALGLTAGDAGVELGTDGRPTGKITAPATGLAATAILAQFAANGYDGEGACLQDFIADANAAGMTAWVDAGGNNFPFKPTGAIHDDLHGDEPTAWLARKDQLNMRIGYYAMSGYQGAVKAKENLTNALPFLGDDMFRYLGAGEDTFGPDSHYQDFVNLAAAKRVGVETHIVNRGDLDAILDGFEAANKVYPIGELNWRLSHPGHHPRIGEPTAKQLERAAAIDAGWFLNPMLAANGGEGLKFRDVVESGARMCLGSDGLNVYPWAPFQALWYATSGDTLIPGVDGVPRDQLLTRQEALRHMTVDCAWSLDLEDKLGTLEIGKLADIIVLDRDYFAVPDDEVRGIKSLLTVVDGRIVHASEEFASYRD